MVGLDAEDSGVLGAEMAKIVAILAGLDEHEFAAARFSLPMGPRGTRAAMTVGSRPAAAEDLGGHGRGGRFAVRAGDGQAAVPAISRPSISA